jgi:hypothetical protein
VRLSRIILLLLVLSGSLPAIASSPDVEKFLWPPQIERERNADRTTGYYWVTNDTFVGSARGGEGVSFLSVFGDVQPVCSSLDDPICTELIKNNRGNWWTNTVLNECSLDGNRYPCIEGVTSELSGEKNSLDFFKYVPGNTWKADDSKGLIPGGAAGLWGNKSKDDGIRYLVVFAGPTGVYDRSGKTEVGSPLVDFQTSIVATRILKGDFKPDFLSTDNSGVKRITGSAPTYCLWVDEGECGYQVPFPANTRLELSVNIPDYFGGFLIGRMKDPSVKIQSLDQKRINLKVSAEPIEVPLLLAQVSAEKASKQLVDYFNNPKNYLCIQGDSTCKKGVVGVGSLSSGDTAFEHFTNFEPFLPPNAALMMPTWSFKSHRTNLGSCQRTSGFQGLVSTNAAIYAGDPPKMVDGELTYKVAGVHHDSAGKVFQGSYDLTIQSAIGRCIYRLGNNSIKASVSVVNSGGENVVATTGFTERDGWIRISVNGFTFSQPTIKVKLTQSTSTSDANVKPTPSATATPAVVTAPAKKVTITCVKGKITKKVSAENPKCPKGYKKK